MDPEKLSGLGVTVGNVHMTATVALVIAALGGFYTAVEWVTHVKEELVHDTAAMEDLSHKIDGLNQVLAAFDERRVSNADELQQEILDIQRQLTDMANNYHSVQRLEQRYDSAFSRYQPQPRQGRR